MCIHPRTSSTNKTLVVWRNEYTHTAYYAYVYAVLLKDKYSATSHIRAVWDQGVPVIVKVPVSMNPLLPM